MSILSGALGGAARGVHEVATKDYEAQLEAKRAARQEASQARLIRLKSKLGKKPGDSKKDNLQTIFVEEYDSETGEYVKVPYGIENGQRFRIADKSEIENYQKVLHGMMAAFEKKGKEVTPGALESEFTKQTGAEIPKGVARVVMQTYKTPPSTPSPTVRPVGQPDAISQPTVQETTPPEVDGSGRRTDVR